MVVSPYHILAIIFCFFIPFSSAISIDSTHYHAQARTWNETYIQTPNKKLRVNPTDLQLIANLLYFSFLRSMSTLEAQEIAIQALETVWKGWQNIAQTRMNPSLKIPYDLNIRAQQKILEDFLHAQLIHRQSGLAYAHCTQAAVKEHYLTHHAQNGITELREQSRAIVAQAFLDIKKILGDLYNFASNHLRVDPDILDDSYRFDFLETIAIYVPQLAMQSFIESERITTRASEQSWNIAHTITLISKQIWDSIESARAAYYLAHYRELITIMHDHELPMPYSMFDENGIIDIHNQTERLPEL